MLLRDTNRISMSFKYWMRQDCESAYNLILDPETPNFDIAF
jgi:hypothetical protein